MAAGGRRDSATGEKGKGWREERRYREPTSSSSYLHFVAGFVNFEQNHFGGYIFVILY